MTLSTRRPSRGAEAREQFLQEAVTGKDGKKRRLNAEIEEALHRRIRIRAAEEGRTVSEITRELWAEYLDK